MTKKKFCSTEMMTKLNNEARWQNLLSNMALEEKSLTTPAISGSLIHSCIVRRLKSKTKHYNYV